MELFYILTEMEIIYQILNVNKVLQLWRTSDQICNTLKSFSLGLIPQTQTFVMNLKEFNMVKYSETTFRTCVQTQLY